MAIRVVEFSSGGYKIRKIFAILQINLSNAQKKVLGWTKVRKSPLLEKKFHHRKNRICLKTIQKTSQFHNKETDIFF